MFEKFAALGPINTRHTKLKPKLDGFMDNHPTKHVFVKTFYKQMTITFMVEFAFCSEVAHSKVGILLDPALLLDNHVTSVAGKTVYIAFPSITIWRKEA